VATSTAPWDELFARRILIVSGKGGTGKSTVAAALALAAADRGRRVLLAEVEGRHEVTRTLGVPDPGFVETRIPFGFDVLSITSHDAMLEYVRLFIGLDRVTRRLFSGGTLEQVVTATPGFRDLLACGKLYEVTVYRHRAGAPRPAAPPYDLVVVDGPPTGQLAGFLGAPAAFSDLVRMGRVRRQAAAIDRMLRTHAAVLLVCVPEEMAVIETREAAPQIAAAGMTLAGVVANRCRAPVFPAGLRGVAETLAPEELRDLVARATQDPAAPQDAFLDPPTLEALRLEAVAEDRRRAAQARLVASLRDLGPLRRLPERYGREGPDRVRALAAAMGDRPTDDPPAVRGEEPSGFTAPGPFAGDAGIEPALDGARIVVVCGSGGVGKTTISAALAVGMAERRDRTVLLTVDPARRLATALRLPMVAGERTEVSVGRGRSLTAIQLDTQRTFDELIERHAGSAERRDQILGNSFYRRIADTLSGTHEYMAMEKLYELATEEGHDAIVIDTPPTRSALSFLDAPAKLTDFLGGRFLRMMLWPAGRVGQLGFGLARAGMHALSRTVGRVVGAEAIADTAEFLAAFEGMYGGFRDRALAVQDLLRSDACAFVVVTSPTAASLEEATFFVARLREGGMRAAAVVTNRYRGHRPDVPGWVPGAADALAGGTPEQRGAAAMLRYAARQWPEDRQEERAVAGFAARTRGVPILTVPELSGDVRDVRGLRRVAAHLFGTTTAGGTKGASRWAPVRR
jgi:anion-transporting  ArsA/GET3 family ATPase